MKKILTLVAAIIFGATFANAQYKPEGLSFSTELNYTPGGASDGHFDLPEYGAKFRLFLNKNMAVRLNLGIGTSSTKTTTYQPTDDNKAYEKTNSTTFSLMPGFEYHFDKFERVSPYVGAQIGFLAGSKVTKSDNNYNDDYTKSTQPGFGFAVGVLTGFDVYLCKGLYLGAELSLGYDHYNEGRGKVTTQIGNVNSEIKGDKSTNDNTFGFHAAPSLRIGWLF